MTAWILTLLSWLRCLFGRMTHCFGLEVTGTPALVPAGAPYLPATTACGDLPRLNQYTFLLPHPERVLRRSAARKRVPRLGPPCHSTDLSIPASAGRSP